MVSHRRIETLVRYSPPSLASQVDRSHGNSRKQHKKQLEVVNGIVTPPPSSPGDGCLHDEMGKTTARAQNRSVDHGRHVAI